MELAYSFLTPNSVDTYLLCKKWASPMAQWVKNPPSVQETGVQSPGWEDPLEEEMATHSSILGWKIPWAEESGGLPSMDWDTLL